MILHDSSRLLLHKVVINLKAQTQTQGQGNKWEYKHFKVTSTQYHTLNLLVNTCEWDYIY